MILKYFKFWRHEIHNYIVRRPYFASEAGAHSKQNEQSSVWKLSQDYDVFFYLLKAVIKELR